MSWFHEKHTCLFVAGGSPPATNLFVANQALQLLTIANEQWGKETSSESDG